MSIPIFLNSSFRYLQVLAATDVATIITNFGNEVLANSWTGSNPWTSPADSGRQIVVTLTRTSQYVLGCQVVAGGVTICTVSVTIPSPTPGQATVHIFTGQFHFHIMVDAGQSGCLYVEGGVLDLSPEAQNAHTHFAYGNGSSIGTPSFNVDYSYMVDNATAANVLRMNTQQASNSATGANQTMNGSRIYKPRQFWCTPTGAGTQRYAGRCYQQLVLNGTLPANSEMIVPIDVGVTGTFKVTNVPASSGGNKQVAYRKA
jgi:hypothetical protein